MVTMVMLSGASAQAGAWRAAAHRASKSLADQQLNQLDAGQVGFLSARVQLRHQLRRQGERHLLTAASELRCLGLLRTMAAQSTRCANYIARAYAFCLRTLHMHRLCMPRAISRIPDQPERDPDDG